MKQFTTHQAKVSELVRMALTAVAVVLWMVFCVSVPAQGQTEDRSLNIVDTTTILARLNSRSANSLILTDLPRPNPVIEAKRELTKSNHSNSRTEPYRDETAVEIVSREDGSGNPTQPTPSDEASFLLMPYLWGSTFKGDLGVRGVVTRVEADFADIIDELNFGATLAFEARWGGRWRFLFDGMYMNLSDDRTITVAPFRGIQATAKTVLIDPEIGYAIMGGESASLDVVGGFRLWHLDNSVELRLGQDRVRASGTQTWADPVVGFRLKAGRGAFLSLKADIGGFGLGSELTWQVFGGLGLNVGSRLTTIIGFRYLDIDYRRNNFIYDVALSGPLVGFGFRF
jgi:hypothetical protein